MSTTTLIFTGGVLKLVSDVVRWQGLFWNHSAFRATAWVKPAKIWLMSHLNRVLLRQNAVLKGSIPSQNAHCSLFECDSLLVHLVINAVIELPVLVFKFINLPPKVSVLGLVASHDVFPPRCLSLGMIQLFL